LHGVLHGAAAFMEKWLCSARLQVAAARAPAQTHVLSAILGQAAAIAIICPCLSVAQLHFTALWLLPLPMQLNISLFAFNLLVPAYPLVSTQHALTAEHNHTACASNKLVCCCGGASTALLGMQTL
jgi:hypothetical protein